MTKKKKEKEPKIAEAVLEGIGGLIPGFSKIFKEAVKAEPFKTRIKEVNREVESKLKGRPLRKSDIKVEGGWKVRSILGEKEPSPAEKVKKIRPTKPAKKGLVDIFDEKNKIRVITQVDIPPKDMKVEVKERTLKIYKKNLVKRTIKLPKPVKKVIKKSYKNNILTVELSKR